MAVAGFVAFCDYDREERIFLFFFSFVFKLILCKFCSLNLLPAFGGELSAISKPVRSGKFCAIMSVVASIVWGLGGTHNYGALGIQI